MKKILFLLLITITFSSCEKDDICVDDTTPRLIVEFYDISNPANQKDVLNLKVKGTGALDYIVFNEDLLVDNPNRYLYNGKKISLPLKVDGTTTKYTLTLNSTSTTGANIDELTFNYTTQNVFVSRACGYKTIFELNNLGGADYTDETGDTSWIKDLTILTRDINNENETHIKVYL